MATILVRTNLKTKPYRLWCNTVDVFISEPMSEFEMLDHLTTAEYQTHSLDEAIDRIYRIGYKQDHLDWLNKYFDSRYKSNRNKECNV